MTFTPSQNFSLGDIHPVMGVGAVLIDAGVIAAYSDPEVVREDIAQLQEAGIVVAT